MVTIEELVIKATPKGISDVNDDLDSMEDSIEETTQKVEDQGSELSGMARKFKGAMAAIVAGIAIGAAGVLSKIPADVAQAIANGNYSEAIGRIKQLVMELTGLESLDAKTIIDKIQSIATDALGNFTTFLTNALNSISQEDIENALSKVVELIKFGLTNGFRLLKENVDWKSLLTSLIKFIGKTVRALGNVVKQDVVGPLTQFIEDNWRDWLDDAIDLAYGLIQTLIAGIKERMPLWKQRIKDYITSKAETILSDFVEDAKDFGSGIIDEMIQGIQDKKQDLIDKVEKVMGEVRSYFPGSPADTGPLSDLDETGPGMVETFSSGVSDSIGRIDGGMVDGDPNTGASRALARTSNRTVISIDGREVERATKTYRDNGTDLRGRYG